MGILLHVIWPKWNIQWQTFPTAVTDIRASPPHLLVECFELRWAIGSIWHANSINGSLASPLLGWLTMELSIVAAPAMVLRAAGPSAFK